LDQIDQWDGAKDDECKVPRVEERNSEGTYTLDDALGTFTEGC
jgi:hypothetical protein